MLSYITHMCAMSDTWLHHMCVTLLHHMCVHSYTWHRSFTCVTWPVHMCDITRLYMWEDPYRKWGRKSAAASNENGCLRAPTISRVTYKMRSVTHLNHSCQTRHKWTIVMYTYSWGSHENGCLSAPTISRVTYKMKYVKHLKSHSWGHTYS